MYMTLREAVACAHQPNWDAVVDCIAAYARSPAVRVRELLEPFTRLGPTLALPRHVATASFESVLLSELSRELGVAALWPTFESDLYADQNPEKRGLLHTQVVTRYGRNGGAQLQRRDILVVTPQIQGVPLSAVQVQNCSGEPCSLPEYHRRWRVQVGIGGHAMPLEQLLTPLRNASDRLQKDWYYPIFFALASAGIVFLEDFEVKYAMHMHGVVERALLDVQRFGLRPRFVHLPDLLQMQWYPESAEIGMPKEVAQLMQQLLASSA